MTGAVTRSTDAVPELAFEGRLADLDQDRRRRLLDRESPGDPRLPDAVRAILAQVRTRGDLALREMAARFDGVTLSDLEVPRREWDAALAALPAPDRAALEFAADAIRRFHEAQRPAPVEFEIRPGVTVGRRAEPLERVGVYAPGGRAPYPSSLLMCALPARAAGVREIVVLSPPSATGRPAPAVMAACALTRVDRLFAVGGAGAMAALAYGTESVPRVPRVVGPGNAWVTEARRQLADRLGGGGMAGPSEVLVVADGACLEAPGAAPRAAVELLAQAEHDPEASAVLVSTSSPFLAAVRRELAERLAAEPRRDVIAAALAARGGLLLAGDLERALDFATEFAPEHLLLLTDDPRSAMARVRGAGSVFLGIDSPVAFGDYVTGTNHVLPTGGRARDQSGLSVADFLRWFSWQEVTAEGAAALAPAAAQLATLEGFGAHRRAAELRSAPAPVDRPGVDSPRRPTPRPRPGYDQIRPYGVVTGGAAIELHDNRNLFAEATPPFNDHLKHERDTVTIVSSKISTYPSPFTWKLKQSLATYWGVGPENVATGCGSDDLLDATIRAFTTPGERVVFGEPTFPMIPIFARVNGAIPDPVPCGPGFHPDVARLLAARGAITYLARPNNPTGTTGPLSDIDRLAGWSAGLVMVDEAYAEFAGDSFGARAVRTDRVVVYRTFSKAHGLAGLRVGYALGPAALISAIETSRGPFKVGGLAEEMALAALADRSRLARTVERTIREREWLTRELESRGYRTWPSAANFLLVGLGASGADQVADRLRARGIAVRSLPALPGAGEAIRVTLAPRPLLVRFLSALDAATGRGGSRSRADKGGVS